MGVSAPLFPPMAPGMHREGLHPMYEGVMPLPHVEGIGMTLIPAMLRCETR